MNFFVGLVLSIEFALSSKRITTIGIIDQHMCSVYNASIKFAWLFDQPFIYGSN